MLWCDSSIYHCMLQKTLENTHRNSHTRKSEISKGQQWDDSRDGCHYKTDHVWMICPFLVVCVKLKTKLHIVNKLQYLFDHAYFICQMCPPIPVLHKIMICMEKSLKLLSECLLWFQIMFEFYSKWVRDEQTTFLSWLIHNFYECSIWLKSIHSTFI